MMMKKIYLPLFAIAALASCTNEVEEIAQPGSNGIKVDLAVSAGDETRIVWDGEGAVAWESVDQFSLYNVAPTVDFADRLQYSANAAYKTENGANFTSENVLFLGKHALVYPLNKEAYKGGAIYVSVGTDGDKTMGENSVFLGTELLNVIETGVEYDGKVYNKPGYHEPVKVSVRPASAAAFFTLNDVKPLALTKTDAPVEIQKVEITKVNGDKIPYSTSAVLATNTEGKIITRCNGQDNTAFVEYTNNKPSLTDGDVTAAIAILPNEAYALTANDATDAYKITVTTNYGIVTIDKAAMVTRVKDGKTLIQLATPAEQTNDNKDDALSFVTEMKTLANRAVSGEKMPNIKREVAVDMTTANINGLQIKNSTDLITAYRAYDLMGKKTADNVTFTLVPTDNKFELTMAAIEAINAHKNGSETAAKLITDGIKEFTITGTKVGEITTVPVIDQITAETLVLAADNKWKIDVKDAAAANKFTNVINKGELQLTQGAGTTALNAHIYNNGTLTFDGAETSVSKYVQNNGTMNIAEGQTVKFNIAELTNNSTTNVNGELISVDQIQNNYGSTINVWGKLLNTKGYTLVNAGTINIKDNEAQVILSANKMTVAGIDYLGVVNVMQKDNNLNTGSAKAKGYVKLPVTTESFTFNAENMGIANYAEFSGKALTVETTTYGMYVEFKANA
ncbi:MAG: hypothetical protein IKU85_07395 [Bacteroidaceae bacterium]|nr:hypothetical protein [Bacteroidaceae bacterium]